VPLDLAALLDPASTAVVTSECQNGVIGAGSALPELADAARETVIPNGSRLLSAAREAGAAVVHCVAGRRPDDRGSNRNARLFAAMLRSPVRLDLGTPAAAVVEEFDVQPGDLVLSRIHGLNPMAGTDLDPVLRNLGVRTLVVVGVSVNVAVTNLVMDAVNHGYQVVLPRDAVAGVPGAYVDAVIDNTLALLATVVTTPDVVAAWRNRDKPA
jgi:nicotinamidase-related amidase